MPPDYGSGLDITSYQIALVIILVLNLLFWLIVIIWRFCYLRRLNDVVERRRAELRNRNEAVENEQRNPDDEIYALSRGDFPPSYNDAIKSHPVFISESMASLPVVENNDNGIQNQTTLSSSGNQRSIEMLEVQPSTVVNLESSDAVVNDGDQTQHNNNTDNVPPPLPSVPPPST